jgi:hypothetical protein
LCFSELNVAAQSLVAVIASFTLVFNLYSAQFFLGEHVSENDKRATYLIVLGSILAVAFAQHGSTEYSLEDLIALYFRGIFFLYATAIISLLAFLHYYALWIEANYRVTANDMMIGGGGGATATPTYVYNYPPEIQRRHRLVYPILSGVMGAQSAIFAKSTAELVKFSIRNRSLSAFTSQITPYIVISCMFFTITVSSFSFFMDLSTSMNAMIYCDYFHKYVNRCD